MLAHTRSHTHPQARPQGSVLSRVAGMKGLCTSGAQGWLKRRDVSVLHDLRRDSRVPAAR